MSHVTNIILHMSCMEDEDSRLAEANKFFDDPHRGLVHMEDPKLPHGWYGGTKLIEAEIAIGAFNYLELHAFVEHLREHVQWNTPECVQLFIKRQHDEKFWVFDLQDDITKL